MLDDREYRNVIVAGARQRALALQALFFDLIRGETRVFRETSLPPDLFPAVLEQEGLAIADLAAWWEGHPREAVRFTYAPDLVRGPDRQWLILEDNLGCVGGVVDGELVVQRFLAGTGTRLHASVVSGANLARAVRDFLARVERTPRSVDVLAVLGDECSSNDPEALRKRQVLEELGMRVVSGSHANDAEPQGLRIRDVRAIVNFSTTSRTQAWDLAGDLFGRHHVPLMMAPGVAALGNKALLPFIDDIVAFYSAADPILRAAETRFCRTMPVDPSGWVLKRSNGCQGREVFFLDRLSEVERLQLGTRLEAWGAAAGAVLQRQVTGSFLSVGSETAPNRFQVELRPFVFVVGDSQCVVAEHASGRAFSNTDGRGVGNMSQGAYYLPVVREPTSPVDAQSWVGDGECSRNDGCRPNL